MRKPVLMTAFLYTATAGAEAPPPLLTGEVFSRQAVTTFFSLTGYAPQFMLPPDDPMINAQRAGRSADVQFAGKTATVSLTGSSRAFDAFKANCDW